MENLTTIPEICSKYNLHANTVRWLINNSKIPRQTLTKKQLNGFTGHLYLKSDSDTIIKAYFKKKNITEQIEHEPPRKHPISFVCEVLRKHLKSSLNNKVFSLWTSEDWKEFNSLIPNQNVQL